jgi:TRAP-type C4-dicarboxylate transport system substrate-binding protein
MRIPENPIVAAVWGSLGCIPVTLPFADVYSALQAGLVDAAENSPTGYTHFAHQEVAKYYLLTMHEISTAWMLVAENAYNALTPELQQQVDRALADTQVEWFRIAREAEIAMRDRLETEMGVTITEPSAEMLEQMRDIVAPVIERLAVENDMQEFLELVEARR